ncbi:unnamed protein product [Ixodes persulcatus]
MAMITSAVYRMYFDETSFSVETVTFRNVTISNRFHLCIIKKTPPNLTICDGAKNEIHLLPRYSCYFESDCYVAGTFCGTIRNSSPPAEAVDGTRPWCCCYRMPLVVVFVHHAVLT